MDIVKMFYLSLLGIIFICIGGMYLIVLITKYFTFKPKQPNENDQINS
jgi:hypothetical protein